MNSQIIWSPGVTLEEIEKQVIVRAFSHFHKNKTATAQALGIAIRTLDARLEKYEKDEKDANERRDEERRQRQDFLAKSRGAPQVPYTGVVETDEKLRDEAARRIHMEPAADVGEKSQLPLQERREVQTVLPSNTPPNNPRRPR